MTDITSSNISYIRSQILQKKDTSKPYFGLNGMVKNVVTDYDNQPYNRYYRGVYNKSNPIVAEREAGFRPVMKKCYAPHIEYDDYKPPNHCFETACSTVYPCYPAYMRKYSDKEELDLFLNRICIDKSP